MYIVYKAYDDNTADILDIGTFQIKYMTEIELIRFSKSHEVLGLSTSGNKIIYINAYSCTQFPTEQEANEYIKSMGLSYKNKRFIQGMWWILEKNSHKYHVDYYICTYIGEEVTYLAEKGYTPYIQSAKTFDKKTAGEKAAIMTKKSKTGKYWTTQRIVVE